MDEAETLYSYSSKEQEDAADDEALSLSSFPLHAHPFRSPAESKEADHFEFLIDADLINSSGDIMCSADDIIINGKLLPCKLPLQTTRPATVRPHEDEESNIRNPVAAVSDDSPTKQELGKKTMESGGFDKAVDVLRKSNAALRPRPRPKWQLLGLGVTKFPTEMELRDIRTRQLRRRQTPTTTTLPPCRANNYIGDDEKVADRIQVGRRQCGWIGSWKLLDSLSCKKHDAASTVVAKASCCPPLSSADPTEIH